MHWRRSSARKVDNMCSPQSLVRSAVFSSTLSPMPSAVSSCRDWLFSRDQINKSNPKGISRRRRVPAGISSGR